MAIREELVSSAAQFLQDPSVSTSSVENKITFLRTKNLTQEEINVALARAGGGAPAPQYSGGHGGPPPQYYHPYPQYAWQAPPDPKRDWRDWFIMATVVGGVGYGLYSLGKRYVFPLVAPPTPERLEQDKKSIEEQFDRAFSLVDQLSKDTEALKEAEKQRTERLDMTLSELETVMTELKAANKRREVDTERIRDEMQALKDAIPKAMNNQKELTNNRLSEINTELTSLKTLVSQRMNPASGPTPVSSYLPRVNGTSSPPNAAGIRFGTTPNEASTESPTSSTAITEPPKSLAQSTFNRGSPLSNGGKASIPAWQMAMANKSASASVSSLPTAIPTPNPTPASASASAAATPITSTATTLAAASEGLKEAEAEASSSS